MFSLFTETLEENGGRQIIELDGANMVLTGFLGDDSRIPKQPLDRSLQPVSSLKLMSWLQDNKPNTPFMVFNLSSMPYDYSVLDDQVVDYKLFKLPVAPLQMLCEIVEAVREWSCSGKLSVLHDISGRRSIVVIACVEIAKEYNTTENITDIKSRVLRKLKTVFGTPFEALVPSQLRYIEYFCSMLKDSNSTTQDSTQQNEEQTLVLERVIVNGVPDFVNQHPSQNNNVSCRPFFRLYNKDNQLIGESKPDNSYKPQDSCFRLALSGDVELSEDILLRVLHRNTTQDNTIQDRTMFSLMINCTFVQDGVLHLTREQVDGASYNARFPPDFFLDLIFRHEKSSQTKAAKHVIGDENTPEYNTIQNTSQDLELEYLQQDKKVEIDDVDQTLEDIEKLLGEGTGLDQSFGDEDLAELERSLES